MAFVVKLYDRFIDGLAIIASAMLAIIFVGIVIDVSLRTAGFNSLQWYSAVAEYCLLFSAMFGAPWLVRNKGHVVVESLRMAMPPVVRKIMEKIVYSLCIILSLMFVYYGFNEFWEAIETGEIDIRSIDAPKWLLFCPIPVGFLLVAIEFCRFLIGPDSYYSGKIGSSESL